MTLPQDMSNNQLIANALAMHANHIETGNIHMSAGDAIKMNQQQKLKKLDEEQQQLVQRLRRFALEYRSR